MTVPGPGAGAGTGAGAGDGVVFSVWPSVIVTVPFGYVSATCVIDVHCGEHDATTLYESPCAPAASTGFPAPTCCATRRAIARAFVQPTPSAVSFTTFAAPPAERPSVGHTVALPREPDAAAASAAATTSTKPVARNTRAG